MSAAANSFDAVILGSGAGGGAAAWKLTKAGLRVCVVERGPEYGPADFIHDELAICRRSFWVPDPATDAHVVVGPTGQPRRTAEGWIACCVGGGTVHMGGYFFRMRPEDLRLRTLFGEVPGASVADWPFAWEELEPYYDEAESILGISGPQEAPHPEGRKRPYPNGPLLSHPASALIEQACARLGLHPFQTPRAILSAEATDGRLPCKYCGYCGSYGCEVGAKSSVQSTFLAAAKRTGKLTLLPGQTALRITLEKDGRARGAIVRDAKGRDRELRGRAVVVACSAIESARLLLNSAGPGHEEGLANGSGLVGKNLMFAAFAGGLGRFKTGGDFFPPEADRLPFLDRSVQDHYLVPKAGLPFPKAGTLLFQRAHFNPIFLAERAAATPGGPPLFGAALQRKLREVFVDSRTIEWEAFSEFLPHPGCQVSLDPEVKDPHGRPSARLQIGVHPASAAASDFLASQGRAVLEAAGAKGLQAAGDERIYSVLQAGTARMGLDAASSVLGADGQAHEVKNLYLADSSGFPSSGGAPFTLTIIANALRVAAGLAGRASRREL